MTATESKSAAIGTRIRPTIKASVFPEICELYLSMPAPSQRSFVLNTVLFGFKTVSGSAKDAENTFNPLLNFKALTDNARVQTYLEDIRLSFIVTTDLPAKFLTALTSVPSNDRTIFIQKYFIIGFYTIKYWDRLAFQHHVSPYTPSSILAKEEPTPEEVESDAADLPLVLFDA